MKALIFLIAVAFVAICALWADGITKMNNQYPDYTGDDFLGNDENLGV